MSNIFEQDRKLSNTYFYTKILLLLMKNLAPNTEYFKIKLIKPEYGRS